jgi:hypothetical protein
VYDAAITGEWAMLVREFNGQVPDASTVDKFIQGKSSYSNLGHHVQQYLWQQKPDSDSE